MGKPKLLFEKARTVLWMAASHGHDCVVLGAFGCGYFNNPADVVAETFRKLLSPGGEFAGVFRMVVFVVIAGNRQAFAERFPVLSAGDLPSSERLTVSLKQKVDEEVVDPKPAVCPGVVLEAPKAQAADEKVSDLERDDGSNAVEE